MKKYNKPEANEEMIERLDVILQSPFDTDEGNHSLFGEEDESWN